MFQTTNQVHIPLISPVKITMIPSTVKNAMSQCGRRLHSVIGHGHVGFAPQVHLSNGKKLVKLFQVISYHCTWF